MLLFRLCRDAFGTWPAFGGLVALMAWPSLFAWSISLLKESLYFLLGAIVLTAAIAAVRNRTWQSRVLALAATAAACVLARDLRPGAVMLIASGLLAGIGLFAASVSRRTFAAAVLLVTLTFGIGLSRFGLEARLIGGLEAAAKTHSGHVFTVGHPYKLLDAGFYVNPRTPVSSTLTLTTSLTAAMAKVMRK